MLKKVEANCPPCDFCKKPIKGTPILKIGEREVMLHPNVCMTSLIKSEMNEKGYVIAGDTFKIIAYAGIPLKRELAKVNGYNRSANWAPIWAVEFAMFTKRLNNDMRHLALHICANLKNEDKRITFCSLLKLGGPVAFQNYLASFKKEEACCKRGLKIIKKMNKH